MNSLRRKVGSLAAVATLVGTFAVSVAPQAAHADSDVIMTNSGLVLTDAVIASPNSLEDVLTPGGPTDGPYKLIAKTVAITAPAGTFSPGSALAVTQCDANTSKVGGGQTVANLCDGRNAQLGGLTAGPGGTVGTAWITSTTGALAANNFQVIGGIRPSDPRGIMDGFPAVLQGGAPGPTTPDAGICPSDAANTTAGFDYCVVALTNLGGGFSSTGLPQEFTAIPVTFASAKSNTTNGTTPQTATTCSAAGGVFAGGFCTVTFTRVTGTPTVTKTPAKTDVTSGSTGTFTNAGSAGCVGAGGAKGCFVEAPGTFTALDVGRFVDHLTVTGGACADSGASVQARIVSVVGSGTRAILDKDTTAFGAGCTGGALPATIVTWGITPYWSIGLSAVGFGSGGPSSNGGNVVGFEAVHAFMTDTPTTCVPKSFDRTGAGSGANDNSAADGTISLSYDIFPTCLASTQKVKVTLLGSTDSQITQAAGATTGSTFGFNKLRKALAVTLTLP